MTNLYKEKYKEISILSKNYEENLKALKEKETKKTINIENHLRSLKILFILRTSKINEKREKILNMINLGCQDIFEKNYELKIVTTDEIEKSKIKEIKYHIILFKDNLEIARNEKLLEASGGGVLSVISVLIKLVINLIYKKDKFFIFDEAMSQVSKQFQSRLSSFLQKFCEIQKVTLILITHMDGLASSADYIYNFKGITDKNDVPVLELIDEVIVNKFPSYHLNIENFQSIVKMDLVFAGFTVIKGASDIGKSSIVRAINSILSNTFNDSYIRLKKSRFDRCSVQFQKYLSQKEKIFDIKMVKEPSTIMYYINDKEYRGKSLAGAAISDSLTKYGFGNILSTSSLSEFNNKKRDKIGNLTVTKQNDHLYLLDNSHTDNNKIISYIFQASTINNGILKVKEKINELKKEKKYNDENIEKLKNTLIIKEKEKKVFYLKYLIEILSNYIELNINIENFEKKSMINKNHLLLNNKLILLEQIYLKKIKIKNKKDLFFINNETTIFINKNITKKQVILEKIQKIQLK